jgi:hypothetical protein
MLLSVGAMMTVNFDVFRLEQLQGDTAGLFKQKR